MRDIVDNLTALHFMRAIRLLLFRVVGQIESDIACE